MQVATDSVLTPLSSNRPRLIRWSSSVESTKDYYTRKEWIQKNRSLQKHRKKMPVPPKSKSERAVLAKKWIISKTTTDLSELCQESVAFKNILTATLASMPVPHRDSVWCSLEDGLCKIDLREFNHCRLEALHMHPCEQLPPNISAFSAMYGLLRAAKELRTELEDLA